MADANQEFTIMPRDPEKDTIIICGVEYSCELFRSFGFGMPGTWVQIVSRDMPRRTVTVRKASDDLNAQINTLAGVAGG